MKQVLLVAGSKDHPPKAGREVLHRMLMGVEGISLSHIKSLEQLPVDLMAYDVMVLYYHEEGISNSALSLFEQFVYEGGGVLAIHSATASFMETSRYFEILGGRFTNHGPISSFDVIPLSNTNIFEGIQPFFVKDELYLHETQPGITTHFISKIIEEEIPVVWTHSYGKGRICYASPGHRTETMCHPQYQRLLKQGLKWVSER